jgi:hypothetical protein
MIGAIRGIGDLIGGGAKAIGDLVTGHPIKALEQGAHAVLGGIGAIASDPLVDLAVGAVIPGGLLVAGAVGQGVGFMANSADHALCESAGIGPYAGMAAMQQQGQRIGQQTAQMQQRLFSGGLGNPPQLASGPSGWHPGQFNSQPFSPQGGYIPGAY